MMPFHNNTLNMASAYQDHYYLLGNMSAAMNQNGHYGVDSRHAGNDLSGNMGNAANNVDDNEQAAWASDMPGNNTDMPGLEGLSSPSYSHMYGDTENMGHGQEVQNDGTMHLADDVNNTNNSTAMNHPQGLQASIGWAEGGSDVKIEDGDDGGANVSFSPPYGGEYDEYDESDESDEGSFAGSRGMPFPKTNKDGARRKPRQPRAKLLKWSDNDWKNVVLGMVWACGETGAQIPFDQAAQIVGESCTAGALQQAVLKLRQKQVSEGNWIPALRMAWTRKPKNSDSSVFNANDAKISKDAGKPKTMLPKKKPTRFSGNQSLIVTLKRAYKETDRENLAFPHVLAAKIKDTYKSLRSSVGAEPEQTPVQKRRSDLRISTAGSPHVRRGLNHDEHFNNMEKIRESNRKAIVNDSTLYQYIAIGTNDHYASIPTPDLSLTPSSGYSTQFGTPTSVATADNSFLRVSTPLTMTPPNTQAADTVVARHLQSSTLNPQGSQQYAMYRTSVDPTTSGNGTYNSEVHGSCGDTRSLSDLYTPAVAPALGGNDPFI